ncbi:MAG: hypothetical protein ACI8WT_003826 [Clostridium sp.]|jgi:hypothetical protein
MNTQLISQELKDYLQNPKKIINVVPNKDFTLTIKFDYDENRIYDMNDKLFGVFEILKDLNKFNEVFIDESGNVSCCRCLLALDSSYLRLANVRSERECFVRRR